MCALGPSSPHVVIAAAVKVCRVFKICFKTCTIGEIWKIPFTQSDAYPAIFDAHPPHFTSLPLFVSFPRSFPSPYLWAVRLEVPCGPPWLWVQDTKQGGREDSRLVLVFVMMWFCVWSFFKFKHVRISEFLKFIPCIVFFFSRSPSILFSMYFHLFFLKNWSPWFMDLSFKFIWHDFIAMDVLRLSITRLFLRFC